MIEITTWHPKIEPPFVANQLPFPFLRGFEFSWTDRFSGSADPSIERIIRCAQLRTVCRAWRDAIDCTSEFTRLILVDPQMSNAQFFPRTNSQGLLECFVKLEDGPTQNELSCFLTPLAERLYSLNTYSPNLIIKPTHFPMLRAIRIVQSRVSNTFAVDLLEMLRAHPDLTELVLRSLTCDDPVLEEFSRLRVDHPGLQRVELHELSSPLRSYLLQNLGLKSSVALIAGEVDPRYLNRPDSAIGNLVRSQVRREFPSIIRGQLRLEPGLPPRFGEGKTTVSFRWPSRGHYSRDLVEVELPWTYWEYSMLTMNGITNSDVTGLIRVLSESGVVDSLHFDEGYDFSTGIRCNSIVHDRHATQGLLRCLPSVKKLIIHTMDVDRVLPVLMEPDWGATGDGQCLCPRLTQLEVQTSLFDEDRTVQGDTQTGVVATIYEFIKNRQGKARLPDGPAKLQKVRIPWLKGFVGNPLLKDPELDGIEVYATS